MLCLFACFNMRLIGVFDIELVEEEIINYYKKLLSIKCD